MIDFAPRPEPAAPISRIWSHARTEALLLVRNGEQLLLALVLPLALLVAGRWLGPPRGVPFAETAPSVLALAIFSTAFTATAIATGFERRQGVLERLAATPLRRSGLVAGKAGAIVMVIIGQVVLLGGLSAVLGWRPQAGAGQWAVVLLTTLAAIVAFVALALAMAGTLRAEITLALANLLHLVVAAGGALVIAVHRYPSWWRSVVAVTPSAALGEAWRATSHHAMTWTSVLTALLWAVASVVLAGKVFRWTS